VHFKSWRVSTQVGELVKKAVHLSPPSPSVLAAYLKRHYPGGDYECVYEAGYCGFWIQEQLTALGIKTIVVHPADVPTSDWERQQKDDVRDSRKLVRSLSNGELKAIYIPDKEQQQDRALVRRRYSIVSDRRRVMNRIKMHLHFLGTYPPQGVLEPWLWNKTFLQWLRRQASQDLVLGSLLAEYDEVRQRERAILKQLHVLFASYRYAATMRLLRSVPGVGFLTAAQLLTEVGHMRRFKTLDQLCSYIGLIPRTQSSGETQRANRRTTRGNKRLRTALIEAAWKAIQHDSELLLCYTQLYKRMSKARAIIKITRKLLNRIRRVWLSGQAYTPAQ